MTRAIQCRREGMTPAEAERLAMLAEECGEVVHLVGKILRHGYDSQHPDGGPINRTLLTREMTDVLAVAKRMMEVGDVGEHVADCDIHNSWLKKLRFAHHQGESA